jgi:hypothetical protein
MDFLDGVVLTSEGTLALLANPGCDLKYSQQKDEGPVTLWHAAAGQAGTSVRIPPPGVRELQVWQDGRPRLALLDDQRRLWLLAADAASFELRPDLSRLVPAKPLRLISFSDSATLARDRAERRLVLTAGGQSYTLHLRNPYTDLPDGSQRQVAYNYQSPNLDHRMSKPYVQEMAGRFAREGRQAALDCVADGLADNASEDSELRHGLTAIPCGPAPFAIADSTYQRVLLVTCPQ